MQTGNDSKLDPEARNFVPSSTRVDHPVEHNATLELDAVSKHFLLTFLNESLKKPVRGEPREYHRLLISLKNRMDPLKLESLGVMDKIEANTES